MKPANTAKARKQWAKMAIEHTTALLKPKPGSREERKAKFDALLKGMAARMLGEPMDPSQTAEWQAGWTAIDAPDP